MADFTPLSAEQFGTLIEQQDTLLTELQLKADLTETQPVSFTGSTDVATQTTLAALNAKLVTGTVLGDVNLGATDNAVLDAIAAKDFATQTTLALIKAKTDNIPALGQALAAASVPIVLTAAQITTLTPPAAITGFATSAKQDTLLTELQLKADLTETQPVSLASVPSHAVTNAGTFAVQAALAPATSGGLTIFRSIDLDETEEEVKATAGQIYGWYIFNAHTATLYLKFYNATAANTTVGTTTPILTIPVPAGSAANVEFTNGIAFSTALSAAVTTGLADNDTGAPAASVFIANIFYK